MNDEKLNQLLDDAMRVEKTPDLWKGISPQVEGGPNWREVQWAVCLGLAVLSVWAVLPQEATSAKDWEPVVLKARLRTEAMTASLDR